MKCEMSEGGIIRIRPETPVEAYALQKWCDEHIGESGEVKGGAMIIFQYEKEAEDE